MSNYNKYDVGSKCVVMTPKGKFEIGVVEECEPFAHWIKVQSSGVVKEYHKTSLYERGSRPENPRYSVKFVSDVERFTKTYIGSVE